MIIHLVTDYGAGDLAFAEVQQRLLVHWPEAKIVPTSVAPFDTLAAGFLVAQLALNSGPQERIIYHNVAPRFDNADPRHANAGEGLAAGQTRSGTWVIGPNAGEVFSLVAPELSFLYFVDAPAHGSQFRSRDIFPDAIAAIIEDLPAPFTLCKRPQKHPWLTDPINPFALPEVSEGVLLYTDGYGNLKTSWRDPDVKTGQRVLIRLGHVAVSAIVSDGSFAVGQGELAFSSGSSGWVENGEEFRFYELFLRGDSAARRFSFPEPGCKIEILEAE